MIINNALYKFAERSHVMYLTTIITVHAVELHLSIKNKDKIVVTMFFIVNKLSTTIQLTHYLVHNTKKEKKTRLGANRARATHLPGGTPNKKLTRYFTSLNRH